MTPTHALAPLTTAYRRYRRRHHRRDCRTCPAATIGTSTGGVRAGLIVDRLCRSASALNLDPQIELQVTRARLETVQVRLQANPWSTALASAAKARLFVGMAGLEIDQVRERPGRNDEICTWSCTLRTPAGPVTVMVRSAARTLNGTDTVLLDKWARTPTTPTTATHEPPDTQPPATPTDTCLHPDGLRNQVIGKPQTDA